MAADTTSELTPTKTTTPPSGGESVTAPGPSNLIGLEGRIIDAPIERMTSPLGVVRVGQVWTPTSSSELAAAIKQSLQKPTVVRSGLSATTSEKVDVGNGIVIQLTELNQVGVVDRGLRAGAGARVEAVAAQLYEHRLALPLPDKPAVSIASSVLNAAPSLMIRTLGALTDYVSEVSGFVGDAQPASWTGPGAVSQAVEAKAVLESVQFSPVPADGLWMERRSFPYPGHAALLSLARALFVGTSIPDRADISLDAQSAQHHLSYVCITGVGAQVADRAAVMKLVDAALASLPRELAEEVIRHAHGGREVIQATMATGTYVPASSTLETAKIDQRSVGKDSFGAFITEFVNEVDRALAWDEVGAGAVNPDLQIVARLQLDRGQELRLTGLRAWMRPTEDDEPKTRELEGGELTVGELNALNISGGALLHDLSGTISAAVPLAFWRVTAGPIDQFKGLVFVPSDSSYATMAAQYATTSYSPEHTRPFMIAYPKDEQDIQHALTFAKNHKKKVVARSGGHQYTAKSSGGQDTIVLSMENFDEITPLALPFVNVGPAVQLTKLARKLKHLGMTIPHGECPLVCVGGHAQTGGYGHLARAFGLTLDHVDALRIVLADGTIRDLSRPKGPPQTDDERLFWGVLGGNAGSFGVVTRYTFKCVKDDEHPGSFGFAAVRRYSKARCRELLKQAQAWTLDVVSDKLPSDLDFMMTVESARWSTLVPLIIVELVHSNLGEPTDPDFGHPRFQPIIAAANAEPRRFPRITTKGYRPLSFWSDHFVRRWPATECEGREFKYPYKKRVNCTADALSDAFIDALVGRIDEVVFGTPGVHLVFQMLIGGGNFKNSPGRPETSIPQRDAVFCFVFDLFYEDGKEKVAEGLQKTMQSLIEDSYSGAQERRVFWGSFGDTCITDPKIRSMYYDDPEVYAKLQALKDRVDPSDLFSTTLTVKGINSKKCHE